MTDDETKGSEGDVGNFVGANLVATSDIVEVLVRKGTIRPLAGRYILRRMANAIGNDVIRDAMELRARAFMAAAPSRKRKAAARPR